MELVVYYLCSARQCDTPKLLIYINTFMTLSLSARSLHRWNVWTKLPAVMWREAQLQGASLLPPRPLRLLLRQWLVWEPL